MNKGAYTFLYVIISSLLNILFTALVIGILTTIAFLILRFGVHASGDVYATALFGCFTVGLVVSFFLYSKISMKIILKYGIAEKIGGKKKGDEPSAGEEAAKKTVLPASVLESPEDEKWRD